MAAGPHYISSTQTAQKTQLPTFIALLRVTQPLRSNGCFSGSTVLVLNKYAATLESHFIYSLRKMNKYCKKRLGVM
jgi:hypothetical protein